MKKFPFLLPLVLSACASLDHGSRELSLYSARPAESWHVAVADGDAQQVLSGTAPVLLKSSNPKEANREAALVVSTKEQPNDALSLRWKQAGPALKVEGGQPLDLRPYLAHGVLAFDMNVIDLANGGLVVKMNCGTNCERRVPFLKPARALSGKGWQYLVFSMSCFVRDGDDFSAVPLPFALEASGSGELAIANVKFQEAGTPNASCPNYKTVSVTPGMLDETWSIGRWEARHQQKLIEAKAVPNRELIFIGDSITQGWESAGKDVWARAYQKYNALDLGFSGDRTETILWRLQHGAVDGLHPKVAVLMMGTNNTGSREEDPKTTAAGIKRNIEELQQRLPDTKILLLAIFPREAKPDARLRQLNEGVNAIISTYADNKKITFLNINRAFLEADGTLSRTVMPDLLHPKELGYEIWAREMAPTLDRLMR